MLDGRDINGFQWVFATGMTDLQVELTVTDLVTGEVVVNTRPHSTPFAPVQDLNAFAGCTA